MLYKRGKGMDKRTVQIAYKKLKSSIYYDKTQLILRDKLVDYESKEIDRQLEQLTEKILDTEKRDALFKGILSHVKYHIFPKSLETYKKEIISNYYPEETKVEDAQVFIDLDVEGHILGVLWLMLVGYKIDKEIFCNSKGNRIRKTLYNEFSGNITFSPYLFEPYYQQYESWRDTAMDAAIDCLKNQKDVAILTLDFRKFYYSVDITKSLMETIAMDYILEENKAENDILIALNDFVYGVIDQYSTLFSKKYNKRKILPIGFLPSNVLANYTLRNFDKAVLDGWNPVYYGRYVDDILIVEKIEDRSDLHVRARDNTLTKEIVLHLFLEECATWKGYKGIACGEKCGYSLFKSEMVTVDSGTNILESNGCNEISKKKKIYHLNKVYNPTDNADDKTEIDLHDDKVKVFYFKAGETDALISCFKKEIGRNKSEFRHMPDDEVVFQRDDYSVIYNLKNSETVNKFRGITELSIDKFELSKLLGKHLRIAGMVSDPGEYQLFKHLKKIFNHHIIIENYTVWEKIIEVLVINESYIALTDFVKDVYDSIEKTSFVEENRIFKDEELQESLKKHLVASISRACALVWNDKMDVFLDEVYNMRDNAKEYDKIKRCVLKRRKLYCSARMIDKSVMPVLIDLLDTNKLFKGDYNLTRFIQVLDLCKNEYDLEYKYHPYLVNSYDLSNMNCMLQLKGKDSFSSFKGIYSNQQSEYIKLNYRLKENDILEGYNSILAGKGKIRDKRDKKFNYLQIMNENRSKLKIGIANVKLNHHNFDRVVKDNPNRSYKRYAELSRIVNMAIDEDVDLLVMPEAYLPIEWLSTLARTCAKNGMAVITGVEHVKVPAFEMKESCKKKDTVIYNLTAVILPFVEKQFQSKNAVIAYHLKNYYAPSEKMEINGYRLREMIGNDHELYRWHGCYFSVFCCYELASISDRALFQSVVDFLVAIEWNKDVSYFSNIMESLSRDMHTYCVQVNTSEYGDSRITAPVKSEKKDVVRTKGGINSTILVGEIDIGALREFQIKEYPLQKLDDSFKPTPPGFDPDIVMRKIKGENVIDDVKESDETCER